MLCACVREYNQLLGCASPVQNIGGNYSSLAEGVLAKNSLTVSRLHFFMHSFPSLHFYFYLCQMHNHSHVRKRQRSKKMA